MNDNIDQQVKFKSTSQEVYDHLAEKDPNSLYFAEDSQRIYKGDTKFSDGFIDEDKFVKVYELSEHEFWDKFSSGDLQIGQYMYPQLGFVADDLPTRVMYGGSSGVVSTNNMYYIMSYWKDYSSTGETYRGGIVTQASHDFSEIKSFKLRDMITDREPSLLGCEYLADNCIGCDDFGYLYMSVDETNIPGDGNVYKYGVIGVNTSQIDDDAEWSVLNTFNDPHQSNDECRMAFRPFNLITSYASNDYFPLKYNPAPTMYRDPPLTTKEGGLFGFMFTNNYDSEGRLGCRIDIPYYDAYRIDYYKSGQCKYFESPANRGYSQTLTGPRCFTTNPDADNKLYYLAVPYGADSSNIMVHSVDADGTYQCYNVVIDDSTKNGFTSIEARYASFIRCKNNKIFVFIGNTNPVCAVLDLTTGEYSNIHKFTNFTFDAEKDYSTVSNIVEGDNSICFTIFNGEICQYVCWNYTEDRIYSVDKRVASEGYHRFEYNSSCDVLREGQSNSIIAYSSNFDDRTVKIQTLSCDDLSVLNTWTLDNAQAMDNGFAFAPIYELPDNKFLVLSYIGEPSGPSSSGLAPAIIDETGNIEYCSATNAGYLGLSSDFNRSVILPSSRKDIYLIMSMDCNSLYSYITLIDTKNMSFANGNIFNTNSNSCRPLTIDNNLLSTSYGWSGDGPSSSILSLGQGIVSYMCSDQKVQINNQGDITT